MKNEINLKDKVWIHIGESKLTAGRVVEIIDLEHLKEGHSPDNLLYIIEIKTYIEDMYEVRNWNQISLDAKGPVNGFRDMVGVRERRLLSRVGVSPKMAEESDEEISPDEIHAAIEKSLKETSHTPLDLKTEKPKRRHFPRKKKL
jgi:hypothetical protein